MTKLLSYLGLAMRAGKLVTGDEIVHKALRSGDLQLVIVAGDASENTKKKFRDKCHTYRVPLLIGLDRFAIGASIGKADRVVVGVSDSGFARMMREQLAIMSEVEYIE
ncbi:putative ribosomal protein YlxQ [Paenibacillus sp. CECT 9249]|uniref:L7Ae/L30e/S12e/Gadd45 family ribosomal protein n=1 Tax=Paenibacillus sp. CECT 9249 TaxID=2845385 RepID=UPI001E491E4D|nr:ribosomal L7Ae/L30e/S12e/Gadd45 family protein [Paenibacillus sp. CECT 9249]CAH0119853.1 putative ribosomal protein YlxQ [Paenibacillus sp. CECT 9249]